MIESPQSHYLKSSSSRPALRIGLLLDSLRDVPAFAAKILRDINASNFARIEAVVVKKTGSLTEPKSKGDLLYNLYLRLDARMKPANDPLAVVDCRELLPTVETFEVDFEATVSPSEVIEKLRSKKLDVLIRFGFDSVPGEVSKAARYGVWWLEPGDDEFYRGGPSHFWEMRERNALSGMVLRAVSAEAREGVALSKSLFATELTISVSRNRNIPYWGSTDLILQKLHELHEFGWDYLLTRALTAIPYRGKRDVYDIPSDREMLAWLGPILLKKAVAYPFRRKVVQHWRIGIRTEGKPLFDPEDSDYSAFRWIDAPNGHAWADPFVFQHEGKYWAFFEDYSYERKRAGIGCAEIFPQGEWGPPMVCLEHPRFHYSYPHVFRDGSEIFMIPESYDANSVDLYRCRQFPNQWVHEAVLMEGKFVDSTIWQHEGLWWLATSSVDPMPAATSLWLYYSSSLTGDWHFHPQNPISRDVRNSRGAGRVFRSQNRLIRPSQSGAPTYGYSITFNEITELSDQRYVERPMKTITPEHWKGLAGVHTYNCAGDLELIDGRGPELLSRLKIAE